MEPATGLLFVPIPSDDPEWKMHLIQRIFETVEDTLHAEITQVLASTDLTSRGFTRQQLIEQLAANEGAGYIKYQNFAGFHLTLWLFQARPHAAYQHIDLDVNSYSFSEIQGDPMKVEAFSAAWVHLCEALGAEAAYFSESMYISPDVLVDEGLGFLQQEDIQGFVESELGWRTYLNPKGRTNWLGIDFGRQARVEQLPSGAFLAANGSGYNPQIGDWDALFNARFLLAQVEKRAEIPGADALLDALQTEEKRLIRIADDKDYAKHGDDAFYDWDGLAESRAILDEVRAIWACALQRPELVGVQQTFSEKSASPEFVVPVIAASGREWLLPTLLSPFSLDDPAWSDPQIGMETRVQYLLVAAQEHLATDEPPQVIVFFWRNVSPEVREALTLLGAKVEVAERLPLLGK